MIKEIIQKENDILRKNSSEVPVEKIESKEIQEILQDMKDSLATQSDGVALAAPQISISKRIFVVSKHVFEMQEWGGKFETVFINPKIIKQSKDKKAMDEGCLSVRPYYGKVKRSSRATVEAFNEKGEKFEMEGSGLLAQIFQHEIDHLDGILFIDKAKNVRALPEEVQ